MVISTKPRRSSTHLPTKGLMPRPTMMPIFIIVKVATPIAEAITQILASMNAKPTSTAIVQLVIRYVVFAGELTLLIYRTPVQVQWANCAIKPYLFIKRCINYLNCSGHLRRSLSTA